MQRANAPLPVMPENRIRLANRSEFFLGCWVIVYVRMVLFTELRGCPVNDNPRD